MGINPIDIAAVLGAAAWIPQLSKFIIRPKLRFLPAPTVEIGYSSFGPIINPTFSISANRRDALIERLELDTTHVSGTHCLFVWQFTSEIPFQTESSSGEIQFLKKEQTATALKIPQQILIDKKIGFQAPSFLRSRIEIYTRLQEKEEHLRKVALPNLPSSLFNEKDWTDFELFTRNNFFWKQGQYTVELRAYESARKAPHIELFIFELSQVQAQILERNIDSTIQSTKNLFELKYDPAQQLQKMTWNWVYPSIERKE